MITEREKQNRDELFRLMRENPELPVVPMEDAKRRIAELSRAGIKSRIWSTSEFYR